MLPRAGLSHMEEAPSVSVFTQLARRGGVLALLDPIPFCSRSDSNTRYTRVSGVAIKPWKRLGNFHMR